MNKFHKILILVLLATSLSACNNTSLNEAQFRHDIKTLLQADLTKLELSPHQFLKNYKDLEPKALLKQNLKQEEAKSNTLIWSRLNVIEAEFVNHYKLLYKNLQLQKKIDQLTKDCQK